MEGKGTSRDLLELEDKNLSSSSSSALESALLVCKGKKKNKNVKKMEEAPSKPTIAPVPRSEFLDKVKGFIGIMAEANKRLEQEAEGNSEAFDIEALTGNESQVIEMDLMLGVADLNTPEAVNAAEAAIAGNGLAAESGDSSSDESDDDDDEEKKSSSGEEGSRKRTKIIELS
ncbi:hypothetical protein EUTSA_v10019781mg [Eutrema salsugineum]|uniref:Uncharacterized protein n=1 Tax=Eutrema salsugineum TaxID=72664 RepID=V4KAH6_EUTSA|nr:uncharacterized protein LOC18007994 [Eutrema salsugineum]ESQ28059.1 hypothetical protein EUTSA_v10019781mg [Eutrema salsugineum]